MIPYTEQCESVTRFLHREHALLFFTCSVHMTHTRAYIQEELGPCPPPTGAEYPHPLSAMETKGARFLAKCSLISNERRYF